MMHRIDTEILKLAPLNVFFVQFLPFFIFTYIKSSREAESRAERAAAASSAAAVRLGLDQQGATSWRHRPLRETLPHLEDGDSDLRQCNEGDWEFSLEEEEEGQEQEWRAGAFRRNRTPSLVLKVCLEPHIDIHSMDIDVHPTFVRVLARGRLLQLRLPCEVRSENAFAQRSLASGQLRVSMPIDSSSVHETLPRGGSIQMRQHAQQHRNVAHRPQHHVETRVDLFCGSQAVVETAQVDEGHDALPPPPA